MEHDKQESLRDGAMSETLGVEFDEFTEWMKECTTVENLYRQMQAGGFIVLNHLKKEAHFKKFKDSTPKYYKMNVIKKLRETHRDIVESPPLECRSPKGYYVSRGILYVKDSEGSCERVVSLKAIELVWDEFAPSFWDS